MNKTAILVLQFVEFEEKYPNAELEDFAAYLLAKGKRPASTEKNIPPHSAMAKVIGRIMRLNAFYANSALKEVGLGGLDEFTYMLSVDQLVHPMKTEVINLNFHELSSGLLIIKRLIQKGLLSEKADQQDKRSVRIALTRKGKQKLTEAQIALSEVSRMFFDAIGDDDIRLCLSMLTPVEQRFAAFWPAHRGKTFGEIVADVADLEIKHK